MQLKILRRTLTPPPPPVTAAPTEVPEEFGKARGFLGFLAPDLSGSVANPYRAPFFLGTSGAPKNILPTDKRGIMKSGNGPFSNGDSSRNCGFGASVSAQETLADS